MKGRSGLPSGIVERVVHRVEVENKIKGKRVEKKAGNVPVFFRSICGIYSCLTLSYKKYVIRPKIISLRSQPLIIFGHACLAMEPIYAYHLGCSPNKE
jgi:hypothetical protein